jgi:7-cyano-7-deazaguanine reductase
MPSEPPPDAIETFINPAPGRDYFIHHVIPEFTSVCPKTGHPDFGQIDLRYVPDRLCIELKSLKLYVEKYRDRGIFYEAVTNKILDDLVTSAAPKYAEVTSSWNPRGGIRSVIVARHGKIPETLRPASC